jgi:hypothetical protein
VLEQYGIAPERIQREAEIVRRAGYEVLRAETWPPNTNDTPPDEEPVADSLRP